VRRAVAAGADPSRILVDPAHDFGKNAWQFFCFEIFSSRVDRDAYRANARSGDTLAALNAATAEREFLRGTPVWSKS
jgi:dihydropteroate synthase